MVSIKDELLKKITNNNNNDEFDHDLIKHWNGLKKRPNIIALDLDYTCWPYFVDCHVDPPLAKRKLRHDFEIVVDSNGFDLSGYKDVTRILRTLRLKCLNENQHLVVASKSTTEALAMRVIGELGWREYFSSFQIYPRNKINHMKSIKEELKFEKFEEILFFDDDHTNISSTSSLGVVAIEVDQSTGLDMKTLKSGLNYYESKHKKDKSSK